MRAVLLVSAISLLAAGCSDPRCGHGISHGKLYQSASDKVRIARMARVQNAIGGVLQADAKTASFEDPGERVAAMQLIDLSDCPRDFRAAYLEHVQAWRKAAELQRGLDQITDRSGKIARTTTSLARPLESLDQAHQKSAMERLAKKAQSQVKASFDQVKTIAASYDVTSFPAA